MGDTSMRPALVQAVLVCLVVVLNGCAHRAASTPAAPGLLSSHTLGAGVADADGFEDAEPAVQDGRAPATPAAPTATTNVKVTLAGLPAERETTIAVNPTNPLSLVAGAKCGTNDCFYSSSDGGLTWSQGVLPLPSGINALTDPSVTFCPDGSAYYEALGLTSSGATERSAVFVYRSTDGGLTWPTFSAAVDRVSDPQSVTDWPHVTCDTTNSAFSGRIYVEYTDPNLVPSGTCTMPSCRAIKIRRSVDNGATWSSEVMVSANPQTPQNAGVLAVGPLGELYVAWGRTPGTGPGTNGIRIDKSTDGGVSFGTDIVASTYVSIFSDLFFSRSTYPIMDVDRSNGPYRGNIYIAFADNRTHEPDILFVRSTNGGTTWSPPVRVNDDTLQNGADQWAPGLAVDPLGRVAVTFYDRRRYVGEERYEVWGAISRDGGRSFDTNFLIGDTASNVGAQTFLGDYDTVAATSDHLYPLWADLRTWPSNPPDPPPTPDPDIYTDPYRNTFRYDEVKGVLWSNATDMSFVTQDARFGADLDYDVVGGLLSALRADNTFAEAACVAPLWPAPPFVDPRVPPDGDAYYYLVRVHGPNGVGTFGDATPAARPNIRDPLDESLVTCP